MKPILLIEDRQQRQENLVRNIQLDLNLYNDILYNAIGTESMTFLEKIRNRNFTFIDQYICIILHKSAFEHSSIDELLAHCKNQGVSVVFFSGSILHKIYRHDPPILQLNSSLFYSNNLKFFLDEYRQFHLLNLAILAYGKQWKTNLLLNLLEKINIFIAKHKDEKKIIVDEFLEETSFESIKGLCDTIREEDYNIDLTIEKCLEIVPKIKEELYNASL